MAPTAALGHLALEGQESLHELFAAAITDRAQLFETLDGTASMNDGHGHTQLRGSIASRTTAILEAIELANSQFHRLVLIVGPPRSGKTLMLSSLSESYSLPRMNLNLALSEALLAMPSRRRPLRVPSIVEDLIAAHTSDVVILDNIEMLFEPGLQQDPLRLLQAVARNRVVVATWRGSFDGTALTYASADHPEYRQYQNPEALILTTNQEQD